jgi:hypothetical protein
MEFGRDQISMSLVRGTCRPRSLKDIDAGLPAEPQSSESPRAQDGSAPAGLLAELLAGMGNCSSYGRHGPSDPRPEFFLLQVSALTPTIKGRGQGGTMSPNRRHRWAPHTCPAPLITELLVPSPLHRDGQKRVPTKRPERAEGPVAHHRPPQTQLPTPSPLGWQL